MQCEKSVCMGSGRVFACPKLEIPGYNLKGLGTIVYTEYNEMSSLFLFFSSKQPLGTVGVSFNSYYQSKKL